MPVGDSDEKIGEASWRSPRRKWKDRDKRHSDSRVTQKVMEQKGGNGVDLALRAARSTVLSQRKTLPAHKCKGTSQTSHSSAANHHRKEEAVCPKWVLSGC